MPRCKNCKEKFEAIHFNQKYCFKSECSKVWIDKAKVQNWKKEKKKLKEELETVQSLTKKAQKYFNTYIRQRDKRKVCISCNKNLGVKFDAGHYFSAGGHSAVRFNEDNVHGQCVFCNQHQHGNLLNYQIGIGNKIGERLFELINKAHQPKKWDREELLEIIETYKKKILRLNK